MMKSSLRAFITDLHQVRICGSYLLASPPRNSTSSGTHIASCRLAHSISARSKTSLKSRRASPTDILKGLAGSSSSRDRSRPVAAPGRSPRQMDITDDRSTKSKESSIDSDIQHEISPVVATSSHIKAPIDLGPPSLHLYTDNIQPSQQAIAHANNTFYNKAKHLFSTHDASFLPPASTVPEVVLLGRSNVGKSSLLNALCGVTRSKNRLATVGKKAGHTKCLHLYGVGDVQGGIKEMVRSGMSKELLGADNKGRVKRNNSSTKSAAIQRTTWMNGQGLAIVDTPGYGSASRSEWGEQIQAYLTGRKQLRRAFVLMDARRDPKVKDLAVIRLLLEHGVPTQLLLTKVDRVLYPAGAPKGGRVDGLVHLDWLRERCLSIRSLVEKSLKDDSLVQHGDYKSLKQGGSSSGGGGGKGRGIPTKLPIQDVLCTSEQMLVPGIGNPGINETRWAILQACGLDVLDTKDFLDGIPILEDSAPIEIQQR